MSGDIIVNEKWAIRTDAMNNHELLKWQDESVVEEGKRAGEVIPAGYYSISRYYGNMLSALRAIALRDANDTSTIQEWVERIEEWEAKIEEMAGA